MWTCSWSIPQQQQQRWTNWTNDLTLPLNDDISRCYFFSLLLLCNVWLFQNGHIDRRWVCSKQKKNRTGTAVLYSWWDMRTCFFLALSFSAPFSEQTEKSCANVLIFQFAQKSIWYARNIICGKNLMTKAMAINRQSRTHMGTYATTVIVSWFFFDDDDNDK